MHPQSSDESLEDLDVGRGRLEKSVCQRQTIPVIGTGGDD